MTDVFDDAVADFVEMRATLAEHMPGGGSPSVGERAIVAAVLVVAARLDWIGRELHDAAQTEADG